MADPPLSEWLARFQAAQPAEHDLRLTNLEAQMTVNAAAMAALIQKMSNLEVQMSQARDAIAELNTETNNLAERVDALLAREGAFDSEVANELRAVSSRLRGLAADPANPVPPVEPTPEPAPEG